MNRSIASIVAFAVALSSSELDAQRYTVDLRGGIAMPTQKLTGADLKPGPSLGGTLAVRLQPHLHLYGGWDWVHFSVDQALAGIVEDFEETGYTLGLRFEHPIFAVSRVAYRLEGSGTYKHIESENAAGDVVSNSGHGLGYEAGAGVLVPLSGAWRLVPGVRFRSLSRDIKLGNASVAGDLRYIALEIGVSRTF
jgi:hypothetical protein